MGYGYLDGIQKDNATMGMMVMVMTVMMVSDEMVANYDEDDLSNVQLSHDDRFVVMMV